MNADPPDFLWTLLALANLMRLSSLSRTRSRGWSQVQEIRVGLTLRQQRSQNFPRAVYVKDALNAS
jgi:hypothetical protein